MKELTENQPTLRKDSMQFEQSKDVFDEAQLDSAASLLPPDQGKIKIRWDNIDQNSETPEEILRMKEILLKRFPLLKINTAILKRYSLGEESEAYKPHVDPDEFFEAPLVLITLSGSADLSIETPKGEIAVIPCAKGTTIVLNNPTLKHIITPPKNKEGVREFLFFGNSSLHE